MTEELLDSAMTTITADIIVIGAGIAGVSVAAQLAGEARVVVLERETAPGTHSTGRSAANWEPSFGTPVIRKLTLASGPFFRQPPDGFVEVPLSSPRGGLMVARESDGADVEEALANGYQPIDATEALRRVPLLKARDFAHFLVDEVMTDVDVDALLGGFLRAFKRKGGRLVTNAEVMAIARFGTDWVVDADGERYEAPIVVNAAGAWADVIAALAGLPKLGLTPKRRSAAIIAAPPDPGFPRWPQVYPAGEGFYCKPTGGRLMLSPADATPVEPHDAWSDDLKLAEAVEAYQAVIDHEVTRLERSWGGLRTFAPDGDPVVGYDPEAHGFFWLAGQGGYGIQTSDALSRLAAALVLRHPVPDDLAAMVIDAASLDPARFRQGA